MEQGIIKIELKQIKYVLQYILEYVWFLIFQKKKCICVQQNIIYD